MPRVVCCAVSAHFALARRGACGRPPHVRRAYILSDQKLLFKQFLKSLSIRCFLQLHQTVTGRNSPEKTKKLITINSKKLRTFKGFLYTFNVRSGRLKSLIIDSRPKINILKYVPVHCTVYTNLL